MSKLILTLSVATVTLILSYFSHRFFPRPKAHNARFFILFSAGYILAMGFLEAFEHGIEQGSAYFFEFALLGAVIFLLIDTFLPGVVNKILNKDHVHSATCSHGEHVQHHHHGVDPIQACASIGCLLACSFIDGSSFYSVAGYLENNALYGFMVIQIVHLLPESLIVGILSKGISGAKNIGILLVAGFYLAGALTSELLDGIVSILPFAGGMMIAASLSQISHLSQTKTQRLVVILGIVAFCVLHYVLHLSGGHSHAH